MNAARKWNAAGGRSGVAARLLLLGVLSVACDAALAPAGDAGHAADAAGTRDAGRGDAGDADAGQGDAGEPGDAGPGDAGQGDAGADAGHDAGPPIPLCEPVDCAAIAAETTTRGAVRALDECAFGLRLDRPLAEGEALADAMIARLETEGGGRRRTLAQVLANLNREGRAGLTSETRTRLSGLSAVGFRWNTGDDAVTYWYPQGITGSAHASAPSTTLLLVSWYHRTDDRPTRGVRVSLVDASDLAQPRYRHLLLVDPIDGASGPDYGPAEYDSGGALHAGGIAWVGERLYVADTSQGLRVYDLSRIAQPSHTDRATGIGVGAGRSDAHGYLYIVPRIGRWRRAPGTCAARFSFVARGDVGGAPVLVSGDYRADDVNGRTMAWPLAGSDLDTDDTGVAWAVAAAIPGQTRVQGALHAGDAWYLSSSSQDGSNGRLYRASPGGTTSVNWVYGAEDLYRDAEDRLWTAAEHPNRRDVVAIPRPR